ncbi:MAG: MerR family transcriptional regulator [Gemmatimonadales bacterium]|jgi:DNA-binding transcriptional MerR regulator
MNSNSIFTIGEVAKETGKSTHTLRYYERVGLIPQVERSSNGHRRYTEDHVTWIRFLDRLRLSGMPIHRMQEYAALVQAGTNNLAERRRILRAHLADIRKQSRALEEYADVVRSKIRFYSKLEKDDQAIWSFPEPSDGRSMDRPD